MPPGPTGKVRADGARDKFLRGGTAMQELIEPMITGKPYPITGLVLYGTNLFHTVPNTPRTKEALRKLDFILAVDVLPQDHIAWADVVLPEATYLERYDELWACSHKTPYIALREPAIEPLYQTKPAWWMVRELGLRLGLSDYFSWETIEQYLNTRLTSIGLNLDKLRQQGGIMIQNGKPYLQQFTPEDQSPFKTPTGKIELFSEALVKSGNHPLPKYEPVAEPPEGYFRLLYGRHPLHTFGKTQNTPVLNELYPENELWINAGKAEQLGLKTGDYIWLENQDGARSGPIRIRATQRIRADAVYMVHGFGHDAPGLTRANKKGASDTALQTRYTLDPISGGAGLRVNFVRVVSGKEA
ncbi:MAG: molybdopterin-dependent oxidoreductase [Chloroflexi bacterium]|nr:molybdopterin-dependent oxidoreductase [Chloroflexota bacterium]